MQVKGYEYTFVVAPRTLICFAIYISILYTYSKIGFKLNMCLQRKGYCEAYIAGPAVSFCG